MPDKNKKPIDYGQKKMVYNHDTCKETAQLYFLTEPVKKNKDSSHRTDDPDPVKVKKCYCGACHKAFDVDFSIIPTRYSRERSDTPHVIELKPKPRYDSGDSTAHENDVEMIEKIECPECGQKGKYSFIAPYRQNDPRIPKNSNIKYEGAWPIPNTMSGRYVFRYDKDGEGITRIDDNIMMEKTVVFPSGKIYRNQSEYSQTMDFVKNRILSAETKIDGNGRTPELSAEDVRNPFAYDTSDMNFTNEVKWGTSPFNRTIVEPCGIELISFSDNIMYRAFDTNSVNAVYHAGTAYPERKRGGIDETDIALMHTETSRTKSHMAMERFSRTAPDKIYTDLAKNGLNLSEHHVGSTEENTNISNELTDDNMYIAARYPGAMEYAMQRADLRVLNYNYNEKRKAEADSSYTAKTATDTAKSKFFRQEMKYVSAQLCACDDKVLRLISTAHDRTIENATDKKTGETVTANISAAEDMKLKLAFFVFGTDAMKICSVKDMSGREITPPADMDAVPVSMRLKDDGKTMNAPAQATKKLKAAYNSDVIATASNMYTLSKWGIHDINHVNTMLDIARQKSPEINPREIKTKFGRGYARTEKSPMFSAGCIAPLTDQYSMRFAKNFMKCHDTTAAIEEIFNDDERHDKTNNFFEDINLYRSIISNKNIKLVQTYSDIGTENATAAISREEQHEKNKEQMRVYFENNGSNIKQAYVDFAEIYKNNTVEMVNSFAREIKDDIQMDKIKKLADTKGMDAALGTYGEYLSKFDNPAKAIDDHKYFSNRQVKMSSRNNKPLFDRSIKSIHDELSEIGRKAPKENDYAVIPENAKILEKDYEIDLASLPKSQWTPDEEPATGKGKVSFRLLDNRYDFVRTATNLSNCVAANSNYFSNVKSGSGFIAVMKNEKGHDEICIEVSRQNGHACPYYIKQIQGSHDRAVDAKYKDTVRKWMSDTGIDPDRDPSGNLSHMGEKMAFYGNGEADFHNEEYDPVLNATVRVDKARNLKAERNAAADKLYNGINNVPEIPEDLKFFGND